MTKLYRYGKKAKSLKQRRGIWYIKQLIFRGIKKSLSGISQIRSKECTGYLQIFFGKNSWVSLISDEQLLTAGISEENQRGKKGK